MEKNVVILAAGNGTKIWPYNEVRNKVMIPVANTPVIAHNVEKLLNIGIKNIYIIAGNYSHEIKNYFHKHPELKIVNDPNPGRGCVDSLLCMKDTLNEMDSFLILYGDTIISEKDLKALTDSPINSILLSKLNEQTGNVIGAEIKNDLVSGILGHPRDSITHRFAGFHLSSESIPYLENCSEFMQMTQVGMMPVQERFIEQAAGDMISDGININAIENKEEFFDLDKPWHILKANEYLVGNCCNKLTKNIIGENSSIDETADIRGVVKLGKNSKIGRNVICEGNLIVGDDTVIDNGAIFNGSAIVGNNVYIGNCCYVSDGSSIGNECFLGHACEFWGILMKRIYLYHYMEMYGIIGDNTDIGAGTVCGTLRFDDGSVTHSVNGRREIPGEHSEAIYLGDYSRTGVNAILLPGVKTGTYSLVGPGVVLEKDLPSRKCVLLKQEHIFKDWGPEKYGW